MSRIAWIGAGLVVATALAIVVNLVTSGSGWWLWLVLGGLVVAAVVIEVLRDRSSRSAGGSSQEISVSGGGRVEDSPQLAEAGGDGSSQKITARRKGIVRRSGQTLRRG